MYDKVFVYRSISIILLFKFYKIVTVLYVLVRTNNNTHSYYMPSAC